MGHVSANTTTPPPFAAIPVPTRSVVLSRNASERPVRITHALIAIGVFASTAACTDERTARESEPASSLPRTLPPSRSTVARDERPLFPTMELGRHSFYRTPGGPIESGSDRWYARESGSGFALSVGDSAYQVEAQDATQFRTVSISRDGWAASLPSVWSVDEGRMVRAGAGITENLRGTESHVEQFWDLPKAPAGSGDLVVRIAVSGASLRDSGAGGLRFDATNGEALLFSHATWIGADGARSPVATQWEDGHVVLRVRDALVRATSFPAVLDPQIGPEMQTDPPVYGPADTSSSGDANGACTANACLVVFADGQMRRFAPNGTALDPLPIQPQSGSGKAVGATASSFLVLKRNNLAQSIFTLTLESYGEDGMALTQPVSLSSVASGTSVALACGTAQCLAVWSESGDLRGIRIGANGALLDATDFSIATGSMKGAACTDATCMVAVGNASGAGGIFRVALNGAVTPVPGVTSGTTYAMAANGTDFVRLYDNNGRRLQLIHPDGTTGFSTLLTNDATVVTWSGSQWLTARGITPNDVRIYPVSSGGVQGLTQSCGGVTQTPQIFSRPGGAFVLGNYDEVVYDVDTNMRAVDAAGAPAGAIIVVNTGANPQKRAAVVARGSEYLVAWAERRLGQHGVYAQRYDAVGQPIDSVPILVAAPVPRNQSVLVGASPSGYLVGYYGDGTVRVVRLSTQGVVLDPAPIAVDPVSYGGSISFDGANYVITYHQSTTLLARRMTLAGALLDSPSLNLGPATLQSPVSASFDGALTHVFSTISGVGEQVEHRTIAPTGQVSAVATLATDALAGAACSGALCLVGRSSGGFVYLPGAGAIVEAATPPDAHHEDIAANADEFLVIDRATASAASPGIFLRRFAVADPPVEIGGYVDITSDPTATRPAIATLSHDSALVVYERDVPSQNSVRIFLRAVVPDAGLPLAATCMSDTECGSNHCVDGVCCDTACGQGADDCQACTSALGGATNGICSASLTSVVCRPGSDPCDAAEHCDGQSVTCGPDLPAIDGTPCATGLCQSGACVDPTSSSAIASSSTGTATAGSGSNSAGTAGSSGVGTSASVGAGGAVGQTTTTGGGAAGGSGGAGGPGSSEGCACRAAGESRVGTGDLLWAALASAGMLLRHRRSRRRALTEFSVTVPRPTSGGINQRFAERRGTRQ